MWIKLILSVLIIAFCTLLGYVAASKYRSRKQFYAQFQVFNERYLTELSYSRRPLSAMLKEFGGGGDFEKLLKKFSETRTPECKFSYLTKEERSETGEYLTMLGRGDSHSQHEFFASKKGMLSEKKAESELEAKKRGDLYLKLGLLAGLAFVILIV